MSIHGECRSNYGCMERYIEKEAMRESSIEEAKWKIKKMSVGLSGVRGERKRKRTGALSFRLDS
jgi:hypothetical protein